MNADTPAPRLFWMERPRHAKCPCGREPLLGFGDGAGTFYGSCCYSDGHGDAFVQGVGRPKSSAPRFRTAEERKAILRCR